MAAFDYGGSSESQVAANRHADTCTQANCKTFIVAVTQTDTTAPIRTVTFVDPHHSEHLLSLSGKSKVFIKDLPVVRLNHIGYGFNHLHMVAFLYSNKAAQIFAAAGAMQPILGIADMLEGENVMFYSIYDNGAKAAMGGFAAFGEIPGVDVSGTFFAPIDSLVAGTMTIDEYAELVKTNSALMAAAKLG